MGGSPVGGEERSQGRAGVLCGGPVGGGVPWGGFWGGGCPGGGVCVAGVGGSRGVGVL